MLSGTDDISLSNYTRRTMVAGLRVRADSNALLMPRDRLVRARSAHAFSRLDYLIEMKLSAPLLLQLQGSCIIYNFCFHYDSNLRFTDYATYGPSSPTIIPPFSVNIENESRQIHASMRLTLKRSFLW